MKLVTYRFGERDFRLGALLGDDRIVDLNYAFEVYMAGQGESNWRELSNACLPPDCIGFLRGGKSSLQAARSALREVADFDEADMGPSGKRIVFRRQEVRLGAPVPQPQRIVCLGRNDDGALKKSASSILPGPRIFSKFNNAVCGPEDPIILPRITEALDCEANIAVVIGKRGREIPKADAMKHVFGYMIMNNVTASDPGVQNPCDLRTKTFDNFAPCGPWLVTKDEIEEPDNLGVKLWINDRLLQDSSVREIVCPISEQIVFVSQIFTLQPGDVFASGFAGEGAQAETPSAYQIKPGDVCRIEIEGLGRLENELSE